MDKHHIDFEQLDELLLLVKEVYGFDFTSYSKASLKRRVTYLMNKKDLGMFELKHELINTRGFIQEFTNEITVNVTEMFRDPSFYLGIRHHVIPYLRSYPHIKLWNAGCASGEETYSFAILLKEEGLLDRAFLYGTDVNTNMIRIAQDGIYPAIRLKADTVAYNRAGGTGSLSDYFHTAYDSCIINEELKKHTLFSFHNLVNDSVFNEFQVVVCRNVLIYFDVSLQKKVLQLLYNSLAPLGFLCLGAKESIKDDEFKNKLRVINARENIYQKIESV